MSEDVLHLVNGDHVRDLLNETELPGDFAVWADALDVGPWAPLDAAHDQARHDYWTSLGFDTAPLTRGTEALARARTAAEVVLWFEHDLFDQLALVRILAHLAAHGRRGGLSLVSIDRHPEVPDFIGLGQLEPHQLAALWPQRTPVGRDALEEAQAAWVALSAPIPSGIQFVARRAKALPFLTGALDRHVEEFPEPSTGLARSERQALAWIARGVDSPAALMLEARANDPRYTPTDVSVSMTVRSLCAAGLVHAEAGAPTLPPSRTALAQNGLTITDLGRKVLAGEIDRVAEVGLDSWRGGVRQLGRGPTWRWDASERRLAVR